MRGIYKITNTNNGKCYIGKSEDLANRITYHIKSLRSGRNKNKHMQNAYESYKHSGFQIEIIEILNDEDDIDDRERYWIAYYSSNNRENGYNYTDGGDGGNSYFKYLDEEKQNEIRKARSEKQTGENNPLYGKHCYTDGERLKYISDDEREIYEALGWYAGIPDCIRERESLVASGENNSFYGKKHSEESKKKMSEGRRGEKNWNYGKHIYHKDGKQKFIREEEIQEYEANGWTKGLDKTIAKKISDKKNGVKRIDKDNMVAFQYDDKQFYGWKDIKKYLNENGYPKISETAIRKLVKGKSVRGYHDLIEKIIIMKGTKK